MTDPFSSPAPPVLPGETLAGKYRIERVIGRGGMGLVLAAKNLELDESVAIKVLAREHTPEIAGRFLREARAAARIRSEHVVRIFDVGRLEGGAPYIVMEYLEGQDLSDVVEQGGRVAIEVAVRWLLEACEALAEAHAQGIIHRDLKPANLFLARRADGSTRIKLLDFGIAKLPDAAELTQTAHLMGSPVYMAPEQLANSRAVDARADVWGLGVVLYELLTGQAPFVAESVLEVAVKVREETHVAVAALCPEIPSELSAIVDCCLAKRREQRFSGVLALARALEPWAPSEALALIGRIERILGGRDDQSTLDISPIVHVDSAPTHEALVARDPTLNALSTSVGPGKQVSHKPYFVRGALAAGALGVAGVVFALARSGPAEPTPNASPAASAAPIVTAAQEPSAVRRPSPSRSVVEPSVEPPAPAPERSTTKLRSPAPSRRREPRDASKPAPVDPPALPAPSAPAQAPASALVPAAPARPVERTIDRNDPW